MYNIGDEVMYGKVKGEVTQVMSEDSYLVMLEDGKEYSLTADALSPLTKKGYKRSDLKNLDFLKSLAVDLKSAGVSELSIKAGEIVNFSASESLSEKIKKYQDEVRDKHGDVLKKDLDAAEAKAKEEFESEKTEG